LKNYIYDLQDFIKNEINSGKEIDYILDNSTIFDDLEPYIPEKIWQVFVITILNGFQSEDIINKIIDNILDED
tara:strand:- start:661 stop:879 length:219 start_codon:yes stop_codon:yes gene_type:complete